MEELKGGMISTERGGRGIQRPHLMARIALRTLSLFLLWRGIEHGLGTFSSMAFQMQMMLAGMDHEMKEVYQGMWRMGLVSLALPLLLAVALWFLAPVLARLMVGRVAEDEPEPARELPVNAALVQVAGLVFIALAVVMVPQIIYGYQADLRRDAAVTVWQSSVALMMIQCLAKFAVGGALLVLLKKRLLRTGAGNSAAGGPA